MIYKVNQKVRRRVRSAYYPDMRPHIFDRMLTLIPYFLMGSKSEILISNIRTRHW